MKTNRLTAGAVVIGLTLAVCAGRAADEDGFRPLFNGKDLAGWDGNPALWSVREGAISGRTSAENPIKSNTFLVWTNGLVRDFDLRLDYKIEPLQPGGSANSGIQYRSKVMDPANWGVGGYQADIEAGKSYTGILYEERMSRGIMAQRGEKVAFHPDGKREVTGKTGDAAEIQASIKAGDWNEYRIVARGSRLQHFVNGRLTIDVTDETNGKAAREGVVALQLHVGPPMAVAFRNIRLKEL